MRNTGLSRHGHAELDVSVVEREIDELVYDLYGLTAAEIRLVEETRCNSS